MKFGDKLIALRKKKGLSQEELASQLNVSRQSVSKWESNNTYPETDKIVQICNIFNCSMDDLINESIVDVSEIERKSKKNFNIAMDSLLDFITKSVNMFASMKFTSGLRCVIELIIIALILSLSGMIVCNVFTSIIIRLISFIPYDGRIILENIIEGLLSIIWAILSIIILIHIFKIRYLDYYDKLRNDQGNKTKEETKSNSKKENFIEKNPKIIIRDPNHEPFAFLSILSKIVMCFIKFFVACIDFGFIITLACLIICLVVVIPLIKYSLIFTGCTIGIFGAIIINIIITLILTYFILNKKTNTNIIFITFISSLFIVGIGVGISIIGLKDIEIKEDNSIYTKELHEQNLTYENNMIITDSHAHNYEFIIDNNLSQNEIVVLTEYDEKFDTPYFEEYEIYGMTNYEIYYRSQLNFKAMYELIINDLKNNIIRSYSTTINDTVKIKASEETINKLLNNLSKIYLYNKEQITNGYNITNITSKIDEEDNYCDAYYDAVTDNIIINEDDCICKREDIETSKGTIIKYSCN